MNGLSNVIVLVLLKQNVYAIMIIKESVYQSSMTVAYTENSASQHN